MFNFDFIEDEGLREQAIAQAKQSFDTAMEAQQKAVDKKIDEAVKGLKEKNTQLIDEKKKIQEKFNGISDPQEAMEALKFFKENEDAQLIRDGKFDELIERKTTTMREDYDEKINSLSTQYEESTKLLDKYKTLYQGKTIEDTLSAAALKAGVMPNAVPDVIRRGREVFSLAKDEKTVEARDENGELLRTNDEDKKILTPHSWVDGLRKDCFYYWPASQNPNYNPDYKNLGDREEAAARAASGGDVAAYRAARKSK